MPRHAPLLLVCLIASAGCTGSRWARADPDYAEKYDRHTDNPVKVVKQALDARHVADKWGLYSSVAASDSPAAEVSVGGFMYPLAGQGAIETRLGLRGVAYDGDGDDDSGFAGGAEAGIRLQSPSRVAPFVGLSGFLGKAPFQDPDPGAPPSFDDEDDDALAAAFSPEVGCHFWLTPHWRLSGHVTHSFAYIEGSNGADYTSGGVTIAYLNIPGYRARPKRPLARPQSSFRSPAVRRLPPACSDEIIVPPGAILANP